MYQNVGSTGGTDPARGIPGAGAETVAIGTQRPTGRGFGHALELIASDCGEGTHALRITILRQATEERDNEEVDFKWIDLPSYLIAKSVDIFSKRLNFELPTGTQEIGTDVQATEDKGGNTIFRTVCPFERCLLQQSRMSAN